MADYTGTSLDANTAADTVARAGAFVSAVDKAFALNESAVTNDLPNENPDPENKISEPSLSTEQTGSDYVPLKPASLEEIRRQARENWLKLRQQSIGVPTRVDHSKDAVRGIKEDQGHAADDALDE
jgi:hypothetical protein